MFALVSLAEKVSGGYRIAEVTANPFPVHGSLQWVRVSDDVTADLWYWTGAVAVRLPARPVLTPPVTTNAPPSEIG